LISDSDIGGTVGLGVGDDSLQLVNGTVNGSVQTSTGNDQVVLSNSTVNGSVNLGAGSDALSITNTAIGGDVILGSGNDNVVLNSGSISGQVIGQGSGQFNVNLAPSGVFVSNGVVNVEEFNILSGRVEQNGDFSTASATTTVSQGAQFAISSPINGGGALVVNGELDLTQVVDGQGPLLTQNGSVTLGAGSEIALPEFQSATDVGQNFNLIQATSIVDNGFETEEDNFLLDFNNVVSAGNLSSEIVVTDLGALTTSFNDAAFADGVAQSIGAQSQATAQIADVLFEFDQNNATGFQDLVEDLNPSVSGAVTLGAYQLAESTQKFIVNRSVLGRTEDGNRNGVWLENLSVSGEQDTNNGIEGFDSDIEALAVGFDRSFGQWRFGGAYSQGDANITNNGSNGSVQIESDQLALYGDYHSGRWGVSGILSYTDFGYDLSRNSSFLNQGSISGETGGDLLDIGINSDYTLIDANSWNLNAIAGLTYSTLGVDSFNEVGGLNLAVDFDDVDRLRSELGLIATGSRIVRGWTVQPSLKLAWKHDFEDATTSFNGNVGGFNFGQIGNRLEEDVFNVGGGVQFSNRSGLTLRVDFNGEFADDEQTESTNASLEFRF